MEGSTPKTGETVEAHPDFSTAIVPELTAAFRLAGYVLADYSEAEDAMQEALLLAWRKWDQLRDPMRLHAWFGQIVVNVCRGRLRKRRTQLVPFGQDDEALDADPFRAALARDAVGRAMSCLNADQRLIVVLRYWGQLTLPEIADRLGVPLGTVKSRHHYGLLALRARLEQDRAEERR